MLVNHSSIQFSAQRMAANHNYRSTEIEVFAPQREAQGPNPSRATVPPPSSSASNIRPEDAQLGSAEAAEESTDLDPQLALLKSIIEAITGRLMELFSLDLNSKQSDAEDSTPTQPPPTATASESTGGIRVRTHHEYAEYESMSFRAQGRIETADGKNIEFSIELQMQRSFVERSQTEIVWGDVPELKDPLVVNFDGRPVALTSDRYAFDINADGSLDQIPGLAAGRAYLILDRNNNGKVDDGSEVIGALSGNAFAELKALDDDGNGFVDGGDVSFSQLGLWRPGNTDNRYDSTQDAGVAALSTDSLATEFKLATADNEQLGQLRRSSIYVTDSGEVKTTQQIDLVS